MDSSASNGGSSSSSIITVTGTSTGDSVTKSNSTSSTTFLSIIPTLLAPSAGSNQNSIDAAVSGSASAVPSRYAKATSEANVIGANGKIVVLGYPEVIEPEIPPPPDPTYTEGPVVIKIEEIFIVGMVLILWVAAIALFFNRWGKIRMLEPYQPKFQEEVHRPSCPMVELSNTGIGLQPRTSLSSKFNTTTYLEEQPLYPGPQIPTGGGQRTLLRSPQNISSQQNSISDNSENNAAPFKRNSVSASATVNSNSDLPSTSAIGASVYRTAHDRRCSYANYSSISSSASGVCRDRRSCSLYPPAPLFTDRRMSCIGQCGATSPIRRNHRLDCYRRGESLSQPYSRSLSGRRTSCILADQHCFRDRRPTFNNVIAQVTADRRPSSNMLRVTNV